MKKVLLFAAVALVAAFGCKQLSDEELIENYHAATEEIINAYNSAMEALQADDTLAAEEIASKAEAAEEETVGKLIDLALTTMKKNPSSQVAVEALKDIYYMADVDQLQPAIDALDAELKTDDFVKKVTKSLEAKKLTAEGCKFADFIVWQEDGNDDSKAALSDYVGKGKYILVDFWASWCGPCKAELPNIKEVYDTWYGDKFDVLSIACWDQPEATKKAAEELGIVWNQIINTQNIATDLYGIDGIPQIILFGPDGTILKRDLRGDNIAEAVAEVLAE